MKFILPIIVALSLTGYAQDGPKVVVFNQADEQDAPNPGLPNMLKLSVLEPFSGDISMYYERIVGNNVSLEAGLGFTIDNYFGSILFNDINGSNSSRTPLIGPSFALGLRYYPFVASEEFYFAPELKYRYYHWTRELAFGNGTDTREESTRMVNYRVTVGYQFFFDDKIFIDYYAGVGLALYKFRQYEELYDSNAGIWTNTLEVRNIPRPWLTLGIKFGFAF